jgi:hypothetical protein
MRLGLPFATIVTLGWLASAPAAADCACSPPAPALTERYRSAQHVLHVRVLGTIPRNAVGLTYRAQLIDDDFKGCFAARGEVWLHELRDGPNCFLAPPAFGEEAIVFAQREDPPGTPGGDQMPDPDAVFDPKQPRGVLLSVSRCGGIEPWAKVDAQMRDFLATRPRSCGGAQTCEGKGVVQCFVDPCQVSECEVDGAVCQSSYCGGCNARWFADGARVCAPAPVCRYDDPARRYFARSPEACKAVRFACGEDEEMFFDPCGCGCART